MILVSMEIQERVESINIKLRSLESIRYIENAQTLRVVACGVLENPPLTL